MAAVVRVLCCQDIKAFAILKLYFQLAVRKMMEMEVFTKVQDVYLDALKKLDEKYPAKDVETVGFKMLRCNLKKI